MRAVYTITTSITNLSTQRTLLYFTAPDSMVIEILSATITNSSNNDNEQLEGGLYRISSLGTPTSTPVTPIPHESSSGDSSVDAAANVTLDEPIYETNPLHLEGWSNLIGYHYDPIPESRILVSPSGSIGLRLTKLPTTNFNCDATITFREIG